MVEILDIPPPRLDPAQPQRSFVELTDWFRLLHKTIVEVTNDSDARLSTLETGGFSTLDTPEGHGAKGTGLVDDSAAFVSFVQHLHDTGNVGRLQGIYSIPNFPQFKITKSITMIGENDQATINGGTAGIDLFDLVSGSLIFENLRTINLALVNSFNTSEGNINEIRLRRWRWTNTEQLSFLVRINFGLTFPNIVKRLIVQDVVGSGGLGGISVIAPVEAFTVRDYEVTGLRVPNEPEHFFASGIMQGSGYSDGLNIGDDDPLSSAQCLYGLVDGVFVGDCLDEREPRPGQEAQAMDGIRIIAENVHLSNYVCRNYRSVSRNDNTGLYLKAKNFRAVNVNVFDAGYHEASVVFKGARRNDGARAPGYNSHIQGLQVLGSKDANGNPIFNGRGAVYLGPGDIKLTDCHIEGVGGPTENPYVAGESHPGMGAIIHCQSTANERLAIENLTVVDCKVGGTDACRVVGIEGYDQVRLRGIEIERIDNGGKFSNQADDVYPTLRLIDVFGPSNPERGVLDIDIVSVEQLLIRGIVANGVNVIGVGTNTDTMTLSHLRVRDIVCDSTVGFGIQTDGDNAVGFLDVIGGDLRQVATPIQQPTTPGLVRISNVAGVVGQDRMRAELGSAQSIAGATAEAVEFTNGNLEGWDDTNFKWVCPTDGLYAIIVALQWVNTAAYTPTTRIRYNNLTATNTLTTNNAPTDGGGGRIVHNLQAVEQIEEGQEISVDAAHTHGSARDVASAGGATINQIIIVKLD